MKQLKDKKSPPASSPLLFPNTSDYESTGPIFGPQGTALATVVNLSIALYAPLSLSNTLDQLILSSQTQHDQAGETGGEEEMDKYGTVSTRVC